MMTFPRSILCLAAVIGSAWAQSLDVPAAVPGDAGVKLPPGFVAFSIEFAGLPPFAGGVANPNTYTMNLMNSLGGFTGVTPPIRSGGTTQDEVYFDPDLDIAILWTDGTKYDRFTIGPAYFDAYNVWPKGTKLSHGFNSQNTSAGALDNLVASAKAACGRIALENLEFWEFGNEPDLFPGQFDHDINKFVSAWQSGTKAVQDAVAQACPSFASVKWMAPSFSMPVSAFNEAAAFDAGLNKDNNIKAVSSHNYISGAHSPGVTLQDTLLNHQTTINSVGSQTNILKSIAKDAPDVPFMLGEANSLYGGGAAGLSNVFGSAIWVVDFSLRCASQSIQRIYYHQSEGAPYSAWNPRRNVHGDPTTFPPYYGNVAVAAFLGKDAGIQVVDFPQADPHQSVYGAYADGKLTRLAVLNMNAFNATQSDRGSIDFTFNVEGSTSATVQRLQAAGSDVTPDVTFNGYSFDYSAGQGMPVDLKHLDPEVIAVEGGSFTVKLPHSEVAIIQLS